jgi:hypothetical protein
MQKKYTKFDGIKHHFIVCFKRSVLGGALRDTE